MSQSMVRVALVLSCVVSVGCVKGPAEFADTYSRETCRVFACSFGSDASVACDVDTKGWSALRNDAIAAGRIAYDEAAGRQCLLALAAMADAACSGKSEAVLPSGVTWDKCELAFAPLVADGQACTSDDECLSLSCTIPANACGGTCATSLKAGDNGCAEGRDCARGFWCDSAAAEGAGTCRAAADVNGACAGDSDECLPGLSCVSGKCQDGAGPAGTLTAGADCTSDEACAGELVCIESKCVARKAAGADCSQFSFGRSTECDGLSVCNGVGLFGGTGKCLLLHKVGEACQRFTAEGSVGDDCLGNLKCDTTSNTCVAESAVGETCAPELDDPCSSPLECVNGKCVKPAGEGAACEANAGCASGYTCTSSKCTLAVCAI